MTMGGRQVSGCCQSKKIWNSAQNPSRKCQVCSTTVARNRSDDLLLSLNVLGSHMHRGGTTCQFQLPVPLFVQPLSKRAADKQEAPMMAPKCKTGSKLSADKQ